MYKTKVLDFSIFQSVFSWLVTSETDALQKILFLDRDGIINHDPGDYTKSIDEFSILSGFLESAKTWYDQGFTLVVITNQAGIDKGLYTAYDVDAIHQYLQGRCIQSGFRIESFYYCPHHPDFNGKCLCRKPGSLMIEKALHQLKGDPNESIMFGDKERDIEAANRAGVRGILRQTNEGLPPFSESLLAR